MVAGGRRNVVTNDYERNTARVDGHQMATVYSDGLDGTGRERIHLF